VNDDLVQFDELTTLALAALAAGPAPRPSARIGLFAKIGHSPEAPAGFSFGFAPEAAWRPHPVPGIRMRVLSINRRSGYATLHLDVDPGVRFPAHHHAGAEECYVIAGSIYTCGRRFGPGDFVHADAGTDHGELWTEEGAQVLLVVHPEDYMVDPATPGS
jgi:anti-sigma factor ChrR (cupin superfamily)